MVFLESSYRVGKIVHWHDHDKALRLVVIKFFCLVGFFMAMLATPSAVLTKIRYMRKRGTGE